MTEKISPLTIENDLELNGVPPQAADKLTGRLLDGRLSYQAVVEKAIIEGVTALPPEEG